MAAQAIIDVVNNPKKRDDLLLLVKRQLEIELSIASYQDDLKDIEINARALGLKKSEFNTIVKWLKIDTELLMNELAFLEALTLLKE